MNLTAKLSSYNGLAIILLKAIGVMHNFSEFLLIHILTELKGFNLETDKENIFSGSLYLSHDFVFVLL